MKITGFYAINRSPSNTGLSEDLLDSTKGKPTKKSKEEKVTYSFEIFIAQFVSRSHNRKNSNILSFSFHLIKQNYFHAPN